MTMATTSYLVRPSLNSFHHVHRKGLIISLTAQCLRCLSVSASPSDEAPLHTVSTSPNPPTTLDPLLVSTPKEERQLTRTGVQLIGSRRRRAALQVPDSIPFEQLPYQCFQEARKILATDREEKLRQIEAQRQRIMRWQARDPAECGGQTKMNGKLIGMQKHLEHLKILADINDPMIKMRFEDGKGNIQTDSLSRLSPISIATANTFPLRRHEPAYLPLSRGERMALSSTTIAHAAHHTNAHCA